FDGGFDVFEAVAGNHGADALLFADDAVGDGAFDAGDAGSTAGFAKDGGEARGLVHRVHDFGVGDGDNFAFGFADGVDGFAPVAGRAAIDAVGARDAVDGHEVLAGMKRVGNRLAAGSLHAQHLGAVRAT